MEILKRRALEKRQRWIAYCIEIGFITKDQIEDLEKIWDHFKDEFGNMRIDNGNLKTE